MYGLALLAFAAVTSPALSACNASWKAQDVRGLNTNCSGGARGYIDDYSGVRISRTGRRFLIERATVWNLTDDRDQLCGQAATFHEWRYLADTGPEPRR